MKVTVELSENLVQQARAATEMTGRSIEDQIEFWIILGRAVEQSLGADRALALLKRSETTT